MPAWNKESHLLQKSESIEQDNKANYLNENILKPNFNPQWISGLVARLQHTTKQDWLSLLTGWETIVLFVTIKSHQIMNDWKDFQVIEVPKKWTSIVLLSEFCDL